MSRHTHRPRRRLKATWIGYQVPRWTEENPIVAQVRGVFQRACNLETPFGRLITLLALERPGPANIVVPELSEVLGRMADDQSVIITPTRLEATEENVVIDLTGAPIWEKISPPDLPLATPSARHAAIQQAMEIALERAESPGLVHLLPDVLEATDAGVPPAEGKVDFSLHAGMLLQARSAIIQLETLLVAGELEAALDVTTRLIGLGLGLTPSGDDFLTGLILALSIASQAPGSEVSGIDAFGQGVVDRAVGCTTWVSVEQLRYAARGEAEQMIAEAVIALLWASEQLRPAIEALLDTGSSSGGDLLTGMCLGVKWVDRVQVEVSL
jgi:hypothetical protein